MSARTRPSSCSRAISAQICSVKRTVERGIGLSERAVRLLRRDRHRLPPHLLAEIVQRVLDVDADQRVERVADIGGGLATTPRPALSTSLTSIETMATRMSPLFR